MLRRSTIEKANQNIQVLTDVIPRYKKAKKSAMATLIINIERLNHPDFPYEWFKERCITKTSILKLPEDSFLGFATVAARYLTEKQVNPILQLIERTTDKLGARIGVIETIFDIEQEKFDQKEMDNIRYYTNKDKIHKLLADHDIYMDCVNNRELLLDVLRNVQTPRKVDRENGIIETANIHLNKSDQELINFVKNLIVDDERNMFEKDFYSFEQGLSDLTNNRLFLVKFMAKHWDEIPPNLVKGKTVAQLNVLSDTNFYAVASAFRNFKRLHPDGPEGKNHEVSTSVAKKTVTTDLTI